MRTRSRPVRAGLSGLLVVLTLSSLASAQPPNAATPQLPRAPDHVLVWSQRPGEAEKILTKLGFTVRKGQTYPEGISSSTAVFGDWSYLELLHFSDPTKAAASVQGRAELEFVARGPGVSSFAVQVANIDAAAEQLRRQKFLVADVKPDMVDPDGSAGPEPPRPASWRDFHFAISTVSGVEPFFIQYPSEPPASPEDEARFRLRSMHANTARRLSAIWVLVPNLDAESEIYRRLGFAIGPAVDVNHLNARARVASLGTGAVVLAQSARLPAVFQVKDRAGPRVIGLSFDVTSLATAGQFLRLQGDKRHYVHSPLGRALVLPMSVPLGFFLEFHERGATTQR